ncbi:hypothetical protein Tco_0288693, partial [Tanacetum coccineum]
MPHDSPLPRGHTLGSDEGILKHDELMELVTKLSDRVVGVEEDMKQTKKIQDEGTSWFQEDIETHEKNSVDTEVLLEELIEYLRSGEKGKKEISTADVPISTAGIEVSTASHDVCTAAAALVYTQR